MLGADVPPLNCESQGLRRGDRLESQDALPDIALYASVQVPARLKFWRSSDVTMCTHRCPLFSDEIGVSLSQTVAADYMHTVCLGTMSFMVLAVYWGYVKCFQIAGASDCESRCAQADILERMERNQIAQSIGFSSAESYSSDRAVD